MKSFRWLLLCGMLLGPLSLIAQKGPASAPDDSIVERVVVLSRHGVRSPLQTPAKLAAYSNLQWPQWDAPPGNLTKHGFTLMASLGSFYREYYGARGLFPGTGCERSKDAYVWSDTDERDVATSTGFMSGLFPGCDVTVHKLEGDAVDPVIHPLKAHLGHPDKEMAAAEVLGTIGGNAEYVKQAYMPAFLTLDRVLGGCGQRTCPGDTSGRQVLFDLNAGILPAEDDDHLIRESKGPLGVASTLGEIMLLEYADGKPMSEVGFGRMSRADLTQILGLHSIYFDLAQATDYPARVGASNIMRHILQTLDAEPGRARAGETGGFGPPQSRFVFLATHDTTIANAAGFLRVHWMMPDDQADPTPPGGALVFELRKNRKDNSLSVRLLFVSETLDQMHEGAVLSLSHPPTVAPVFIPGCSVAARNNDCPLAEFRKLVTDRELAEFTTP